MENIKFARSLTKYCIHERKEIGDNIFFTIGNGNVVKASCGSDSLFLVVINNVNGKIDSMEIPFSRYFKPVRCSNNAPFWTQRIESGKWCFENMYPNLVPTENDYTRFSKAVDEYIEMFE